jgi:D-serine deaminase-like pyridoxal phosphate-dependent protein
MAADDLHARYETAFASVAAPFAFVDLDAMWSNATDLLRMAGGVPIRVASKSVRCRALLRAILDRDPGFRGLLTFTLAETLWLAEDGFEDLVLAYPTADRQGLEALAALAAADLDRAPAVMVDSSGHLDLIESVVGTDAEPIRVCLELDVAWWPLGGRLKVGPKRSPVRTPEAAAALAREIAARPGVRLAGLMAYEGHIAGVGDDVPGSRLRNAAVRAMQRRSARELRARRAAVVEAVSAVTSLELVNGGGTGSLTATASEPAVTEVTAGSGFYDSVLFDHYRSLDLRPAAGFAMPVVRKPTRAIATVLGGGYVASGPPGKDRLPEPYLPPGLRLDGFEGAGEV